MGAWGIGWHSVCLDRGSLDWLGFTNVPLQGIRLLAVRWGYCYCAVEVNTSALTLV